MNGWMNEWVNGWIIEWIEKSFSKWIHDTPPHTPSSPVCTPLGYWVERTVTVAGIVFGLFWLFVFENGWLKECINLTINHCIMSIYGIFCKELEGTVNFVSKKLSSKASTCHDDSLTINQLRGLIAAGVVYVSKVFPGKTVCPSSVDERVPCPG